MKQFRAFFSIALLLVAFGSSAQFGETDLTFNPIDKIPGMGTGFTNGVNDVVVQPDGKVIMVGGSWSYNKEILHYIVRTDSAGLIDTSFHIGSGFDKATLCVALQADGKILVGGEFTAYNGQTAKGLVRLLPNGSLDTSFHIGTGVVGFPRSFIVLPDQKILIGGSFSFFNDTIAKGLIRVFPNGSIDTSFNPGSSSLSIKDMVLQTDGTAVIVGDFLKYGTVKAVRIARIDSLGNIDTSFKSGFGFSHPPECVAIQPDGKIVVGGQFLLYDSVSLKGIVRLNSNGSIDSSFSIGSGFNATVYCVFIQTDSTILVGGAFNQYNGTNKNSFISLKTDGSINGDFIPYFVNGSVVSMCRVKDNRIMLVGAFTQYGSVYRFYVARIYTSGRNDLTFNTPTGFDYDTHKVVVDSRGKILVGGNFSVYNGVPQNAIVRLLPDGELDTSFYTGSGFTNIFGFASDIRLILLQPDGKILVAGNQNQYNGVNVNSLVRLNDNGSLDTTFNAALSAVPECLALQADGKILVGYTSGLKRLKTDGTADATLNIGTGFNKSVNSILVQPDSNIIVAGNFTTYKGSSRNRIVRILPNGTIDNSFSIGSGFDGEVLSLALEKSGKILVGGSGFSSYNGSTCNNIARIKPNGAIDTAFKSGQGFPGSYSEVWSIIANEDGKIIISGFLQSYDTNSIGHLVKIDTTGKIDTSFMSGYKFNNTVKSIALQYSQNIIAAGFFTSHHNFGRNHIARVINCESSFYHKFDTVCYGATYTFNSISFSKDTVANFSFPSSTGCDSVIVLHLAYRKQSKNTVRFAVCDSFVSPISSNVYKNTGVYAETIVNGGGCDSTISFDLTIHKSTVSNILVTACDAYTTKSGHHTWTSSGVYYDSLSSAFGCDSVLRITLTISKSNNIVQNITACNQYLWPVNNTTYNKSGTYSSKFTNAQGCDSVITLNLVINNSTNATSTVKSCGSFTWAINGLTYTKSGSYTATLINDKGCDSIITLNLTIVTVDVGVTNTSPVLKANAKTATYQWLNCDKGYSKIIGETSSSFTATANGNYAVMVSQNGCTDTSACYAITGVGIEKEEVSEIKIYPNPASDKVFIEFGGKIHNVEVSLKSITGQTLALGYVNDVTNYVVHITEYPAGIYFVEIKNEYDIVLIKKIIKE